MITDYRAILAELVSALADFTPFSNREEVALAGARTALAEPQPPAGEVAELVKFLRDWGDEYADEGTDWHRAADLLELLVAPVEQSLTTEPTDEELLASLRYLYADQTAADMGAEDDLRTARAVLARFARPAPQPIPVSERLPEAGDCDAEGRCWLTTTETDPGWVLDYPERCTNWTHWLPAHALPVPSGEVE